LGEVLGLGEGRGYHRAKSMRNRLAVTSTVKLGHAPPKTLRKQTEALLREKSPKTIDIPQVSGMVLEAGLDPTWG